MEKGSARTNLAHGYSTFHLSSVGLKVSAARLTCFPTKDNRDRFVSAVYTDLGKPKVQIEVMEIVAVANDVSTLRS